MVTFDYMGGQWCVYHEFPDGRCAVGYGETPGFAIKDLTENIKKMFKNLEYFGDE